MPTAAPARDIVSAGVVVLGPGKTVLLVHRPKYDDWSFPKGKLDRGERAAVAAVREVDEETGLRVRLGPPLSSQRYAVSGGMKTVHYWSGTPIGDADISGYQPNDEIDQVEWLRVDKAPARLSYRYDEEILAEALAVPRRTRTLAVLRHSVALSKKSWRRRDDRTRPLTAVGRRQSLRLVPVLAAYDVRRLVTSSSARCVQTMEPYAEATGFKLLHEDLLSEEDSSPKATRRLVAELLEELHDAPRKSGGLVLCSHRPVLPWIFEALDQEDPRLEKGEFMVLHVYDGKVVAAERHLA